MKDYLSSKESRVCYFLFFFVFLLLQTITYLNSETLTIYTGVTSKKTTFLGASLGGEIFPYLNLYIDGFKYLKNDEELYSPEPEKNRGDFGALSINIKLRFPIDLLPYLDKFDYIQPYIVAGYGYGIENFSGAYHQIPDKNNKTGFFTKVIKFHSFGYGIIFMLSQTTGIKIENMKLNLNELERMGYPARQISRFSLGICFESKKQKTLSPSGGK